MKPLKVLLHKTLTVIFTWTFLFPGAALAASTGETPATIKRPTRGQLEKTAQKIIDSNRSFQILMSSKARTHYTDKKLKMAKEQARPANQKFFSRETDRFKRVAKTTAKDSVFFFAAGVLVSRFYSTVAGEWMGKAKYLTDPQTLETNFEQLKSPEGFAHFFLFIGAMDYYNDLTRSMVENKKDLSPKLKKFLSGKYNGYAGMAVATVVASIVMEMTIGIKDCTYAKIADSHNAIKFDQGYSDVELSKKQQHIEACDALYMKWISGKGVQILATQMVSLVAAAGLGGILQSMVFSPVASAKNGLSVLGKYGAAATKKLEESGFKSRNKKPTRKVKYSAAKKIAKSKLTRQLIKAKTAGLGIIGSIAAVKNVLLAMNPMPIAKVIQFTFFLAAQTLIEPLVEEVNGAINTKFLINAENRLVKSIAVSKQKGWSDSSIEKKSKIHRRCSRTGKNCKGILESLKFYTHENRDWRMHKMATASLANANWFDYVIDMTKRYDGAKLFYEKIITDIDLYDFKKGVIPPFDAVLPVKIEDGQLIYYGERDESLYSYTLRPGVTFEEEQKEPEQTGLQKLEALQSDFEKNIIVLKEMPDDISFEESANFLFTLDQESFFEILNFSVEDLAQASREDKDSNETDVEFFFKEVKRKARLKAPELIQTAKLRVKDEIESHEKSIVDIKAERDRIINANRTLHTELLAGVNLEGYNKYDVGRVINIKYAAQLIKKKLDHWKANEDQYPVVTTVKGTQYDMYLERINLNKLYDLFSSNRKADWSTGVKLLDDSVRGPRNRCKKIKISLKDFDPSVDSEELFVETYILTGTSYELFCTKDLVYDRLGWPKVQTYINNYLDDYSEEVLKSNNDIRNIHLKKVSGFKIDNAAEDFLTHMVCGPRVSSSPETLIKDTGTEFIGEGLPWTSLTFLPPRIVNVKGNICKKSIVNKLSLSSKSIYESEFQVTTKYNQKKTYTNLLSLVQENIMDTAIGPIRCAETVNYPEIPMLPGQEKGQEPVSTNVDKTKGYPSCNYGTWEESFSLWWSNNVAGAFEVQVEHAKKIYGKIVDEVISPAFYGHKAYDRDSYKEGVFSVQENMGVSDAIKIEWSVYINEVLSKIYTSSVRELKAGVSEKSQANIKMKKWGQSLLAVLGEYLTMNKYKKLETQEVEARYIFSLLNAYKRAVSLSSGELQAEIKNLKAKIKSIQSAPSHPDAGSLSEYKRRLQVLTGADQGQQAEEAYAIAQSGYELVTLTEVELSGAQKKVIERAISAMESIVMEVSQYRGFFTDLTQ